LYTAQKNNYAPQPYTNHSGYVIIIIIIITAMKTFAERDQPTKMRQNAQASMLNVRSFSGVMHPNPTVGSS